MKQKMIASAMLLFSFVNADLFAQCINAPADTLTKYIVLPGHKGGAYAVVFDPGGKWMVSGGLDDTIKVWDATTNKLNKTLPGHTAEVTAMAYSADGKYLASAGYDNTVIIWETSTWKKIKVRQFDSWSTALAFNQNGQLAAGFQSGEVIVMEIPTGRSILSFDAGYQVNCLLFSTGEKHIITAGPVTLWDARTGKKVKRLNLPGGVNGLAVAPGTTHLASVHSRGTAYISDLVTGDTVYTYTSRRKSSVPAPTGSEEFAVKIPIVGSSFSANGKLLALACYDNTILIFCHEDRSIRKVLAGQNSLITALTFDPGSKKLAGCSADGRILIWDIQ